MPITASFTPSNNRPLKDLAGYMMHDTPATTRNKLMLNKDGFAYTQTGKDGVLGRKHLIFVSDKVPYELYSSNGLTLA